MAGAKILLSSSRTCCPGINVVGCLLATVVSLTTELPARADGFALYRDAVGWHPVGERSREAVLLWQDGRERMSIRVALEESPSSGQANAIAWVLPVPAPADQIKVDVLRGWPIFTGVDVGMAAVRLAHNILSWSAGSQLWPLVFAPSISPRHEVSSPLPPLIRAPVLQDGIAIEVVSARAMAESLARMDVSLPHDMLQGLSTFVDARSSFVVYRVVDLDKARRAARAQQALGIAVDFPSPAAGFFPLAASSSLPGGPIDIRVTVHGFVHATGSLPPMATTFYVGAARHPERPAGLADTEQPDTRFTELRIVAYPRALRHDLRFEATTSRQPAWLATWVAGSRATAARIAQVAFCLAVLATLASLATRPLWPRDARPSRWMSLVLGISHLGTVVSATVVALLLARRLRGTRRSAILVVAGSSILIVLFSLLLAVLARRILQ